MAEQVTSPTGLLTRTEASLFQQAALGKHLLFNHFCAPEDLDHIFKSILGHSFFDEFNRDVCALLVVNDTKSPLVLDGEPVFIHGWLCAAPTGNSIPPAVDGCPTWGCFGFTRYALSVTGAEGALQFAIQRDLPNGITLGVQIPGSSSQTMQVAAMVSRDAAGCADKLDNSKYGSTSSDQSVQSNELGTVKTTVTLDVSLQRIDWSKQSWAEHNYIRPYLAVAYLGSTSQ